MLSSRRTLPPPPAPTPQPADQGSASAMPPPQRRGQVRGPQYLHRPDPKPALVLPLSSTPDFGKWSFPLGKPREFKSSPGHFRSARPPRRGEPTNTPLPRSGFFMREGPRRIRPPPPEVAPHKEHRPPCPEGDLESVCAHFDIYFSPSAASISSDSRAMFALVAMALSKIGARFIFWSVAGERSVASLVCVWLSWSMRARNSREPRSR